MRVDRRTRHAHYQFFYARNGNGDKTKHSKDITRQPDDKSAT